MLTKFRTIWFIVLFALAQMISVVHAQVHEFHEASDICQLLDRAIDPRVDVEPLNLVLIAAQFEFANQVFRSVWLPALRSNYWGRAPPTFA